MEIRRKAAALLASTALAALPMAASAQGVTLKGSAEMGIAGGKDAAGVKQDAQFHQDIDVTFGMSGTTDQGFTFGAAVDLDEDAGAVGTDDAGVSAYVEGVFGRIELGDTDGALDWAVAEVPTGPGSLGDNEEHGGNAASWRNNGLDGKHDGQILRYNSGNFDVGVGTLAFGVSAELVDGKPGATCFHDDRLIPARMGTTANANAGDCYNKMPDFSDNYDAHVPSDDPILGFGVKGSFAGGFSAGLGFQRGSEVGEWDLGPTYNGRLGTGDNANAFVTGTGNDAVPDRTDGDAASIGWDHEQMKYLKGTTSEVAVSFGYAMEGFAFGVAGSKIDNAAAKRMDRDINAAVVDEKVVLRAATATNPHAPGFTELTDATHLAVGAQFGTGPFSFGANWGSLDYKKNSFKDVSGVGVSAGYDLGGGASVLAGYGSSKVEDAAHRSNSWSLGLKMAF